MKTRKNQRFFVSQKSMISVKTIILALILMIPIAYAFSGSNANYNIDGNLGLGAISEHSSANYKTKGIIINQPIGQFESEDYSAYLGLYYLEGMGYFIDIEIFSILLNSGWNLLSIPLGLNNKTLAYALTSIDGNYTDVFSYLDGWIKLEDSSTVNETMGFWINMINQDTFVVKGTTASTSIQLNNGWNLVGYPYLQEKNVSELFENNTVYSYNISWSSYIPNRTFNSLQTLNPGYGYWVRIS